MEILIFGIVALLTAVAGFVLALRSVERTVGSVVEHLKNTVGGKPIELWTRELDLRDRQADLERRKADLEIRIRENGYENEKRLADLRFKQLSQFDGSDVES